MEEYTISWLEIYTPRENIVIQKDHAPCILELKPNETILFQLNTGKQKTILIHSGFVHVLRDYITIIVP
jgi:F0F1-type ATP synthase epsilon subunit